MNRQWRLKHSIDPNELVGTHHFSLEKTAIPEPAPGEVLLRTLYLGTSPAQRGYVSTSKSMHEKVVPGEVMRGRGIARVVRSNHPKFKSNDIVVATTGWQDYAIIRPDQEGVFGTYRISNPVKPLSLHLGILGAAGMTAYFGLTDVAATKPTDTVLVTAAAGGVGSCAVQIARCLGKDVIGVAGGLKKCQWLSESLNVAHVIDYKNQDLGQVIDAQCPNGVDVFFDNVGGQQLDCVLERLALGARVVICGFISTDYEHTHWGPKNYKYLLRRRAKMEGFFIFDYFDRFGEAEKQLASWYAAGDIQGTDDVVVGLEHMPDLLRSLFTGGNRGVCICQVAENGEL